MKNISQLKLLNKKPKGRRKYMKSKIIKGVIITVIFFAGVGIGNSDDNPVVEKEVIKEVTVEKIVEKNNDDWKELKTIDDEGFIVAGESMGLCGQGYEAIFENDVKKLEQLNEQMNEKAARINILAVQRQALLKKLGY